MSNEPKRSYPTFQEVYPGFPEPEFEPLKFTRFSVKDTQKRAFEFYQKMLGRRTIRHFSPEAIPRAVIEHLVLTACTAPSGAHRQPWKFVAIQDSQLKAQVREAVEEEYTTYTKRMPPEWRAALAALGTDYIKEHLTEAPWLVIVFREKYGLREDGSTYKNYYTTESVAMAVGIFIAAIQHAGLATLTHTPSPMGFLCDLLKRPKNEEPMLIMPIGYPAPKARVPKLGRKKLEEILEVI